jgi:hypothetical protein
MRQAANLKDLHLGMLLAGITINTNPSDFAPIKQMRMQRFTGENWEPSSGSSRVYLVRAHRDHPGTST